MLMENIANGQKVANYTLEAFVDGKWQAVVPANRFKYCPEGYNASPGFETIGHKKIDRIVPVVTDKLRFRCTKAAAEPVEIAQIRRMERRGSKSHPNGKPLRGKMNAHTYPFFDTTASTQR